MIIPWDASLYKNFFEDPIFNWYLYVIPEWNEIEAAYNFAASAFSENLKESRKSTLFAKVVLYFFMGGNFSEGSL